MLEESSKALAHYPIVEMVVAAGFALATLWLMLRADKGRQALPPEPAQLQVDRVFLDGPVNAAMESLASIEKTLIRWEEDKRVAVKINDQLAHAAAQHERERWHDVFNLLRDGISHLEKMSERQPRR